MTYTVKYDDKAEALRIQLLKTIAEEDVKEIIAAMERELEGKSKRLLLFDLSKAPSDTLSKGARKAFKDNADLTDYDKVAMFGASPSVRMMAKVAITVSGLSKISRFFKTEDEAISWLKE